MVRNARIAKKIPRELWLPAAAWRKVKETMPIPCVDVIFERQDESILYGWRLIRPYKRVWALLGGRMLRGESLQRCAYRIADEYGLAFDELYLNGVFPLKYSDRSDVVISVAARKISGQPRVDQFEFSKFTWSRKPPERLGNNYLRMIKSWNKRCKSKDFLKLSRLS